MPVAGLIAYLGHDDVWLPDHLEAVVAGIEETGADFVYTLGDVIAADGSRGLSGSTPSGRWEPWAHVPTGCWLVRREVLEEVGPWRSALEMHETPQEELMLRIHKAGKEMRLVPRLTVVKIPSGSRMLVYARRESSENEEFARRIQTEPDFRERELTLLALRHASGQHAPRSLEPSRAGLEGSRPPLDDRARHPSLRGPQPRSVREKGRRDRLSAPEARPRPAPPV